MHVFMNDLLGSKASAANNRKVMEASPKENVKAMPSHLPSLQEREEINEETGKRDGDRKEKQDVPYKLFHWKFSRPESYMRWFAW